MCLADASLLASLVGVPSKLAAEPGLRLFSHATSPEGQLSIRKYWDAHCSTLPRLPAIALLDLSSCPRGLTAEALLGLLSRLTSLQPWEAWDLWDVLDVHSCGFVGCPEFTLLVVLLCAAASAQQLEAVHAFSGSIHRVFAGGHVASRLTGLGRCCRLLGVPALLLDAAVDRLRLLQRHPTGQHLQQQQQARVGQAAPCACGRQAGRPSCCAPQAPPVGSGRSEPGASSSCRRCSSGHSSARPDDDRRTAWGDGSQAGPQPAQPEWLGLRDTRLLLFAACQALAAANDPEPEPGDVAVRTRRLDCCPGCCVIS